jgi:hypothetical protein
MSPQYPLFITSDRGSNIQAAIRQSQNNLTGIPCFSHVMHRAVLGAIDTISGVNAVNKVVKMSTFFKQSVPRYTAFHAWQKTKFQSVLMCITVSRTRWHGYLDSMLRHITLQPRIKMWLKEVQE